MHKSCPKTANWFSSRRSFHFCPEPPNETYAKPKTMAARLVQSLLLVGLDGAVGGGVRHAGQHEAVALLGIVQEGLVGLVDGASHDLAGAAGASTSAARVGQVQAGLLRRARGREAEASSVIHHREPYPEPQMRMHDFNCFELSKSQPIATSCYVACGFDATKRQHGRDPTILACAPRRRPGCRCRRGTQWSCRRWGSSG